MMKSDNQRPMFGSPWLKIVAGAMLALYIVTFQPPLGAQAREHWVSTWATALVDRPLPQPGRGGQGGQGNGQAQGNGQGQGAPGGARGQAAPGGQAAAPQGPPPVTGFNNQTLRQIVHVS